MNISISIPMTYDSENTYPDELLVLEPSGNGFVQTVNLTIGNRKITVKSKELQAALEAFAVLGK